MEYTSRGLQRRRGSDKWEVTLSHRDPISGEQVSSYHTVEQLEAMLDEARKRENADEIPHF